MFYVIIKKVLCHVARATLIITNPKSENAKRLKAYPVQRTWGWDWHSGCSKLPAFQNTSSDRHPEKIWNGRIIQNALYKVSWRWWLSTVAIRFTHREQELWGNVRLSRIPLTVLSSFKERFSVHWKTISKVKNVTFQPTVIFDINIPSEGKTKSHTFCCWSNLTSYFDQIVCFSLQRPGFKAC